MNFGSHGTFQRHLIKRQSLFSRLQGVEGRSCCEEFKGKDTIGNNPNPSFLYHSLHLLGAYRSSDDLYCCLVVGPGALGCWENQKSLRNRQDTQNWVILAGVTCWHIPWEISPSHLLTTGCQQCPQDPFQGKGTEDNGKETCHYFSLSVCCICCKQFSEANRLPWSFQYLVSPVWKLCVRSLLVNWENFVSFMNMVCFLWSDNNS